MAEASVPQVSLSAGSEAVFDIECAPCSGYGQHKEAECYCRDCGGYLCKDCVRDHQKVPSLRHHQLTDKDAINTTHGKPQVLDACTERCQDHRNEIIKFYCPDHGITACVACVALDHKRCDHTEYIEDAAAGLEDRQDYKEFTARLGDLTQQSEDTVTLALENKQKSTDCHTKTMQELDAYEEELVSTVHRHVEAIRDQAGQIHGLDTDKMDKMVSQGNKVLTELRVVETNVNNLKSRRLFCKLFVEMKQKEQTLRELQGNLEDMRDEKVASYTFKPNEELRAMVGMQDSLGKLVIESNERDTSTTTSEAAEAYRKQKRDSPVSTDKSSRVSTKQAMNVPVSDVKTMKVSHTTDINVRSSSNKSNCLISGMTVVADDKVVVADWVNKTIKLIDTNNNTISEYKPEQSPWDVTTCKDTIAATLREARKIVFLKHARGLVYDREITVNGNCRGIDCYDYKLYVIFDSQNKLEVMTPVGVVLQTFSTTARGEQLFLYPQYVTVNAANQRIYVSESRMGCVVVLDLTGNQTGTYQDGELGQPRQLAVDEAGVMFLCDCFNNTVHLLSPVGKKVKILLTRQDGVDSPYSVCYCEKSRRLFVGQECTDTIKVYTVS